MTDLQYLDRAEFLLASIESCCDRINESTNADIDNQRVGGMVTISFENGSQIVVNLQRPLEEVWLACRSGGFHYRWTNGHWQDTKAKTDFYEDLSRVASQQAGQPLLFGPPS